MGILNKFGGYKAYVKCPNCGYGSEVKIPKGVSVADFIKGGKCKCDNCQVVFFPDEYTTGHFEKEKKKDMNITLMKKAVEEEPKKFKELPKHKEDYKIKW